MSSCLRDESKHDLDSRGEIHDLVVGFYREVAFDDLLGPIFCDVAKVDWSSHVPKLVDYWSRVLLGQRGYDGFILTPHQRIHGLQPFRPELFDRWYLLFVEAVDDRWRGPIAERAKIHAARMSRILAGRLLDHEWDATSQHLEDVNDLGNERLRP